MSEQNIKLMMECSDGWLSLLLKLDKKLSDLDPDYKILQIKEKFGTLRFYAECKPEVRTTFFMLIDNAEMESSKICEGCGSIEIVEQPESMNWIKTLCQNCWDKRVAGRRKNI